MKTKQRWAEGSTSQGTPRRPAATRSWVRPGTGSPSWPQRAQPCDTWTSDCGSKTGSEDPAVEVPAVGCVPAAPGHMHTRWPGPQCQVWPISTCGGHHSSEQPDEVQQVNCPADVRPVFWALCRGSCLVGVLGVPAWGDTLCSGSLLCDSGCPMGTNSSRVMHPDPESDCALQALGQRLDTPLLLAARQGRLSLLLKRWQLGFWDPRPAPLGTPGRG